MNGGILGGKKMEILNESTKGDQVGEYTFTGGKGNTVIGYVIGDEKIRERIGRLKVGNRVDSKHHSLKIWMKGE